MEGFDSVPLRPLGGPKPAFDGGVLSGKAKGVPAHWVNDLGERANGMRVS